MLGVERLGRALRGGSGDRAVYQTSRPPVIGASSSVLRTTSTVSSADRLPSSGSSAVFIGADRPLRRDAFAVISAFASENSMRSRTDSGEKPPNTTLCGAPMRAHASIATTSSGIIGR